MTFSGPYAACWFRGWLEIFRNEVSLPPIIFSDHRFNKKYISSATYDSMGGVRLMPGST